MSETVNNAPDKDEMHKALMQLKKDMHQLMYEFWEKHKRGVVITNINCENDTDMFTLRLCDSVKNI